MRTTRARVLIAALCLAAGAAAGGAVAAALNGLWFPDVMIIERSPFEIHPPRWNLTVYPGAIEYEFLTDDELRKLVSTYCAGIPDQPVPVDP